MFVQMTQYDIPLNFNKDNGKGGYLTKKPVFARLTSQLSGYYFFIFT